MEEFFVVSNEEYVELDRDLVDETECVVESVEHLENFTNEILEEINKLY